MPILNKDKTLISDKDAKAIEQMLKGSLEEHIERLKENRDSDICDDPDFYKPIIEVYQNQLDNLKQTIQDYRNQTDTDLSVGDFMDQVFDNIAEKTIEVIDKESPEYAAFSRTVMNHFGNVKLLNDMTGEEENPLDKDTTQGFDNSAANFTFVNKPMPGIEKIGEYNPATDSVKDLYKGRTANSTTLSADVEKLQKQLNDIPDDEEHAQQREKIQGKIDGFVKGTFGLNAGAEVARIHSVELMNKEQVTFGDLFNAISEINEAARPGDPAGGKLRGIGVSAGKIEGTSASYVPKQLYNILDKVADGMNQIKQIDDKNLQKTMAVQLAAFAYQMTLSAHSFGDGNGRSCRLFSDTILQTFGLPPNTPIPEQQTLSATMGEKMDFSKGADAFYKSVQLSDDELKKDPEIRKQARVTGMPEKQINNSKTSTKLSALYEVDDETIRQLKDLQKKAKKVSGTFKDSKQYKDFRASIDKSLTLAQKILANELNPDFDMKKAEAEYASSIRGMRKAAKSYKDYKLKDKTADKKAEPGKKKLNSDDKKKLDLIESVEKNEKLITVKQKKPPVMGR